MVKWYERQMRIVHPTLGRTESEVGAVDMVQLGDDVVNGGFNTQHLRHTMVWDGEQKHFLYQTDKGEKVVRDVLGEYLPEAHKRGIKVFIYMNVHWAGTRFITENPNWIQRKIDRSPLTGLYGGQGTSCCVNTSWRDWVFGIIEEMAVQHEIDGIFFDGPCVYHGACYCDSCRAKFEERHGFDIKTVADSSSPHWPELIEFHYDSIADFLGDANAVLKAHRPDAPLYMNANGLHSGARAARNNRKLIPHQDILGAEGGFMFYGRPMDVPLWKVSATAKYLEAQADGKPTVIFSAVDHKPWKHPLTALEICLNTAATFACGASPWLGGRYQDIHDPAMQAVAKELGFFAEHEDELSGTVAKAETALLWSNVTADYYKTHLPEIDFMIERPEAAQELDFQGSFYGGYEGLMRSGTPFQIVDEVGIESGDLTAFNSLLITDAACMSEATAEAIRAFVAEGGQIIVTGQSSLYDERGYPREEFLLSDVIGASYGGPRGLSSWDMIWIDPALRAAQGIERASLPSPTYQMNVAPLEGASIVGKYYEPTPSRYSRQPALSEDAAIIANRYGDGKSLYLAGTWAKHYWTYRIDECGRILSSLARQEPLVQVTSASTSIEVSVRVDPDRGDFFIHLLNYTGGMDRPIKATVPLQDVEIKLRTGRDPTEIDALRAAAQLPFRREGGYVVVQLEQLTHHEVVRVLW